MSARIRLAFRLSAPFVMLAVSGCHNLSNDYNHTSATAFWSVHPNLNDSAAESDAERRPIDQQYAIYRYGMEYYRPCRMFYGPLVVNATKSVPLLVAKTDAMADSRSLWTIMIVFEAMQAERRYNFTANLPLLVKLHSAVKRATGPYADENAHILAALESGNSRPIEIPQLTDMPSI